MKRIVTVLMCVLFVLTLLFPAGTLIAAYFGYTFQITYISAFTVTLALLSVCAVALHIRFESAFESKITTVLSAIITPFALINATFFIFTRSPILAVASVLIAAGCCCFLTIKRGRPAALKIIALSLSTLLAYPVGLLGFISVIFGHFGQNTVVQSVDSLDGTYYAEVVYSDQGALGGNTVVEVYEQGGLDAVLFKIKKTPQRMYSGEWYEYETIQIYWKSDSCLVINSQEYDMATWLSDL